MARTVGIIESKSYLALVDAVDRATKAAPVRPVRYERIGEGLVAAVFEGDLASLQVALQAAGSNHNGDHVETRLVTNVLGSTLGIFSLPGGGLRP